ncbi:MAG: hypothetical protein K2X38_00210 [Gemmataceae bacterium]|nr:hypothetical protein [Gemmataceae bacterium]
MTTKRMTPRRRNQIVGKLMDLGVSMSVDGVIAEPQPLGERTRHDEVVSLLAGPQPREKTGGERALEALRAAASPAEWARFTEAFEKAQRGKKNSNRAIFEMMLGQIEKEANR